MKKIFSLVLIIALGAIVVGNATTTYASGDGDVIPPLPKVDVKINGSDGPLTVKENSIATVSWSSTDAVGCEAFGNPVPLVNPLYSVTRPNFTLLTTELFDLPTDGSFEIYARDINPLVVQLNIGIYCTGQYYPAEGGEYAYIVNDYVTVNLADSASVSEYLESQIYHLQNELADVTAQRDNISNDLANATSASRSLRNKLMDVTAQRDNISNDLANAITERDALTNRADVLASQVETCEKVVQKDTNKIIQLKIDNEEVWKLLFMALILLMTTIGIIVLTAIFRTVKKEI